MEFGKILRWNKEIAVSKDITCFDMFVSIRGKSFITSGLQV